MRVLKQPVLTLKRILGGSNRRTRRSQPRRHATMRRGSRDRYGRRRTGAFAVVVGRFEAWFVAWLGFARVWLWTAASRLRSVLVDLGERPSRLGREGLRVLSAGAEALRGGISRGSRLPNVRWRVGFETLFRGVSPRSLSEAPRSRWGRLRGRYARWRRGPGSEHVAVCRARSLPGSRDREYVLHLPPGHTARGPMPLVVVLHGCMQSHRGIQAVSAFDAVADREGFAVVYPFVTSYSGMRLRNCWGWWQPAEIRPGAGEVQDVWHVVEDVQAQIDVDPQRIHVTGLSSGAGMAVAAMVAHCDRIASGAAVAGVPYSETVRAVRFPGNSNPRFKRIDRVTQAMDEAMGSRKRPIPLFIVHSHDDRVVHLQASLNLRDSWAQCFDVDTSRPVSRFAGRTGETLWKREAYRRERNRRPVIETLFIGGGGHGWYGGDRGEFSYPEGPDISRLMWAFFRRHPLRARDRDSMSRSA